ncbi:MAG: flagellar hook-basal body complex protein [Yoonia sp.]|uniref:flagellar hook protein FlgE n=1 Tax=Rhodobacterales TaxID=204455 RepID=UPI001FF52893|nr:flagellar hook-basal body complex protein [Loktanella sp. F6476L]MCK0120531.1 flagellar hook-basal body complex protein [Loktanella sp. F6476L]UWQ99317.1 flagellar hook-basal body complex protein [Rhodobacteraceae bacterium S2214]
MTISSSLNAGVAGLSANATRLATISDNIANSSTFGYKRAVTDFQSLVISDSNSRYTAGGVRTTTGRLVDERGSLVSTSNSTDLAVRGRGMLPVTTEASVQVGNGENPLLLATTGSFRADEEGYLRSPAGLVLLGWAANADGTIPTQPRDSVDGLEPIKINSNQFAGEPTTEVDLAVNLPATSTEAGSTTGAETLSIEYFDNLGKSANLTMTFSPTVPATGTANEWQLQIFDSASGGTLVGDYQLDFDPSRAGGGTLLNVTDNLGTAPYDPATGSVTLAVAGGPLELTVGTLGSATGLTQLSDTFAPTSISKNGSAVGSLTAIDVDANGFVRASFDSGINRVLYQVPLVDVSNVNGLEALDQQSYRVSPDSGSFFLWDAGDGPTGDVVSFAREESATDVAGELTQLIQTQRAYSSNAKVIQTVDEMLQETTNIKR